MPLSAKAGWLLLLAALCQRFATYRWRWEFGPFGVPHSLVAADGRSYLDGTPIDPITLAIIRSGYEPTINAAAIVVLSALMIWAVRVVRSADRIRRETASLRRRF